VSKKLISFSFALSAALVGTTLGISQSKLAPTAYAMETGQGDLDMDILHSQVLLDRAGFAPGVIDGRKGMSFDTAVKGFQTSRGLEATGKLDQPTLAALQADMVPATRDLRIDQTDAQDEFTPVIPKDPTAQANLGCLCYRNLLEKIAEKFHTTSATLLALNDPNTPMTTGSVLRLPNVLPRTRSYAGVKTDAAEMLSDLNVSGDLPKADRIVVDKSDGVLRLFGSDGQLMAQFPATMGSTHDPLPLGQWKVTAIDYNPAFHYQPELFWDVADTKDEQHLPPGPNGPVGTVWIDLTKEHYGIHGTGEPQTIQRAQSHGCIRLTNWDAARVAYMVKPGMEVIFQA
jgi:lipoprotein-anchoring transpeptidase ErfK/SrfK